MRRWLMVIMLVATQAVAEEASSVRVQDAWLRALPPSSPAAAIYLTLINEGNEVFLVQGASCEGAKNTMLHETVREGGMDKMREVKAWEVPPHGRLVLAPGGKHLMAMGLQAKAGEKVRCTLNTSRGAVSFSALVRPAGAR